MKRPQFSLFSRLAVGMIIGIMLALGLAFGLFASSARNQVWMAADRDLREEGRAIQAMVGGWVPGDPVPPDVARQLTTDAARLSAIITLVVGDPVQGTAVIVQASNDRDFTIIPIAAIPHELQQVYRTVVGEGQAMVRWEDKEASLLSQAWHVRDAEGTPGVVLLQMQVAAINTQVRDWYVIFLYVILPGLLVGLVLAMLMASTLSRPMREMNRAVRAIGQGRFERRVKLKRTDEVGELAQGINHMAQALSRADRDQAFFIASVSHELRAPMTSIRGFVQAVRDGVATGPAANDSLDIALTECDRLSRLIEVMLMLMRAQSQGGVTEKEAHNLVALTEHCIAAQGGKPKYAGVRFQTSIPPELTVNANSALLQVVLNNILDNAMRYSPEGGTITITAARQEPGVAIWIDDEGPGVPTEMIGRIFDDFITDNAARTPGGGVGLGLSLAKRIIHQHGGMIQAQNREEGGLRVSFLVPY